MARDTEIYFCVLDLDLWIAGAREINVLTSPHGIYVKWNTPRAQNVCEIFF